MVRRYAASTMDFYRKHVERYYENTVSIPNRLWLERFALHLTWNSLVLDVGCGFGRDAKILGASGYRVCGFDFSLPMLLRGRSLAPSDAFCCMDLVDFSLRAGGCDGIWCSSAIVHVSKGDARRALRAFWRTLRTGGVLYLGLKEGEGEGAEPDLRYDGWEKYYAYYSLREAANTVIGAGFRVIEVATTRRSSDEAAYTDRGLIHIIAEKSDGVKGGGLSRARGGRRISSSQGGRPERDRSLRPCRRDGPGANAVRSIGRYGPAASGRRRELSLCRRHRAFPQGKRPVNPAPAVGRRVVQVGYLPDTRPLGRSVTRPEVGRWRSPLSR